MSYGHMNEKRWEEWLVQKLQLSCGNCQSLSTIPVRSKTGESSIGALCGDFAYEVFKDTSHWNHQWKEFYKDPILTDISGGMGPDIVLRSKRSNQNRIYIEVKEAVPLRYGVFDSQVVRYFIHLLTTSTMKQPDLRRAILLAAPNYWFDDKKKVAPWDDFCDRYAGLASVFDITLGEIRLNAINC
jgi:hypothetical protein